MLPKRDRHLGDYGTLTCYRVRTCQEMSHLNVEKTKFNEEWIGLNGELININEELIDIWCLVSISRDPMDN